MVDVLQVHADLVGPTRLRIQLDKTQLFFGNWKLEIGNSRVARHRFFPTGYYAKPLAVPRKSANRRPNFTFFRHNNTVDNRKICFFYESLFKLPLELAEC